MEQLHAAGPTGDSNPENHVLTDPRRPVLLESYADSPTLGHRITAPAIPVTGVDFTVAAWFNWTTNPSPYYSGIQGGGYSWELRVQNNGHFAVVFYQAIQPDIYTTATSPLAYNVGEWHHVAGVLRNGLAEIY